MFGTKNVTFSIKDIPDEWFYETFIDVDFTDGLPSKINSPLRVDNIPSFGFFLNDQGKICWHDFRSGQGGIALSFAIEYVKKDNPNFGLNQVYAYLLDRYNREPKKVTNKSKIKIVKKEFHIKEIVRPFNGYDLDYWGQYKLTKEHLILNRVKPIDSYIMTINNNSFSIRGLNIYGYYTNTNELYKIYQPKNKDQKFLTINKNIIEGIDSNKNRKYNALLSGKKDIMTFDLLNLDANGFAGNSETSYLTQKELKELKINFTILDNDKAGIESSLYYKNNFGIPFVYYPYEKDISDSIKTFGVEKTRELLVPLINNILNES